MADLLPVETALERVLARILPLNAETVPTPHALARALARDATASTDIPPFANSSMDGYAVRAADIADARIGAPVRLAVILDIAAGAALRGAVGTGEAARIMTGAPIPDGADVVVPVEDTDASWNWEPHGDLAPTVEIHRSAEAGSNIRPAGEDVRAGQVVLARGTWLRPSEIGMLVALGLAEVEVSRRPRVAIVATGDELVDLTEPLAPGKIRNSNSYVLAALVEDSGGLPLRMPIAGDTSEAVRDIFLAALDQAPDIIVSSAGVSVGARDVVRGVVSELGELELWRVNLRPGKPLAFGHLRGIPFFGLPGNPVSAFVTFLLFVRPALRKLMGTAPLARTFITAVVGEPMVSDGRESYVRVRLEEQNGEQVARTTGTQSSGALFSLVRADGLLVIPAGVREVKAGSHLPVWLLR